MFDDFGLHDSRVLGSFSTAQPRTLDDYLADVTSEKLSNWLGESCASTTASPACE